MMKQYLDASQEELRYNDYLMGRNRKAPQTSTGNSLFGNTANLFGNQVQTPTTGFQFNPHTPFNFQFSNPTSIFGNSGTPLTNAGTGLFGQQSNTVSNTGANFFGQTNNTAAKTGMGLFGQPSTSTGFGTGLFGQPTLFGQPANTSTNTGTGFFSQPATSTGFGTGLFGQPTTTTGLFGQPTNTGAGVFGNSNVTAPAQNASFWNTCNTNNVAKSPFSFGTTPLAAQTATPQFQWGNNNQQQPQSGFQFQPFQNQNIQPQQQFAFPQPTNDFLKHGFSNVQQTQTANFSIPQPQQPIPPQQLIWNGLGVHGQVPTALSHGRYPSIFNPDPEYNSPLYNWVTNSVSGRTLYASGLNPLLQSHLIPPHFEPPLTRTQTSRTPFTFTAPSSEFINWNTVVKNNIHRAQSRNTPAEPDSTSRFRPAFKSFKFDDDLHGDVTPQGREYHTPPASRRWKRLDSRLVSGLESCGPDNRYSFSNPGPKIGERRCLSARRHLPYEGVQQLEVPSPRIGFFEQPFESPVTFNPSPPPSSSRRQGPPIRNDSLERINISVNSGASDFEGLRSILRQPEPTVANLPHIPAPVQFQQQTCTRKKVQFMEGNMPPPSPRDGLKLQVEPRGRSRPRPRSQSHTLRLQESNFPCRVITLTNPKYYCIPDVTTLHLMTSSATGQCLVENFEVGHEDFGKIIFPGILDVKGINLDAIIKFQHKEVQVYPDDIKPPYSQELNRLAIVTLAKVWPLHKITGQFITDEYKIDAMGYEDTLRRSCNRFHGNFVSYNAVTGMWTFQIQTPPTYPW